MLEPVLKLYKDDLELGARFPDKTKLDSEELQMGNQVASVNVCRCQHD